MDTKICFNAPIPADKNCLKKTKCVVFPKEKSENGKKSKKTGANLQSCGVPLLNNDSGSANFAGGTFKKHIDMENIIEKYRIFEKLIDEEQVYKDGTAGFGRICRAIGADPERLDALIKEETGFSGQEIISSFRKDWVDGMNAKFGLVGYL